MDKQSKSPIVNRRGFLKLAGGLAGSAALAITLPGAARHALSVSAAQTTDRAPDLFFAGTDGWVSLPRTPAIPPFHPDPYAPASFTTYIFGFRDLTGMTTAQVAAQKNHAQHIAPLWWMTTGEEFHVKLTNLGLAQRPDLVDSHTIHFHGFRDAIPYFDGEPHGSVSVPIGKELTYVYRPHDPGTYMYHCHVEDVEHVQMGMAGMVFVRPAANPKWAYNDPATAFDREFAMMMTEFWAESHWCDAHIQLPEWSDYRTDFALLNGRVYPDTLAPNAPLDTARSAHVLSWQRNASGDLVAPAGRPDLQYQPLSSVVRCQAGEKVLLRFANLGYSDASMTLAGIPMRIVGKDATPMKGRDGTDTGFWTSSLEMHAGASYDAIFTAPAFVGPGKPDPAVGNAPYDTYLLYNRAYQRSNNLASGGFGGQATEVRVFRAGALGSQTLPNT